MGCCLAQSICQLLLLDSAQLCLGCNSGRLTSQRVCSSGPLLGLRAIGSLCGARRCDRVLVPARKSATWLVQVKALGHCEMQVLPRVAYSAFIGARSGKHPGPVDLLGGANGVGPALCDVLGRHGDTQAYRVLDGFLGAAAQLHVGPCFGSFLCASWLQRYPRRDGDPHWSLCGARLIRGPDSGSRGCSQRHT